MQNDTNFSEFNDVCPVHNTEIKKEYDFGMDDAHVVVFAGCKCAVSFPAEPEMFNDAFCYHTDYTNAASRARLIVAGADAQNAPFTSRAKAVLVKPQPKEFRVEGWMV